MGIFIVVADIEVDGVVQRFYLDAPSRILLGPDREGTPEYTTSEAAAAAIQAIKDYQPRAPYYADLLQVVEE